MLGCPKCAMARRAFLGRGALAVSGLLAGGGAILDWIGATAFSLAVTFAMNLLGFPYSALLAPVGKQVFTSGCDVARAALANAGVSYEAVDSTAERLHLSRAEMMTLMLGPLQDARGRAAALPGELTRLHGEVERLTDLLELIEANRPELEREAAVR